MRAAPTLWQQWKTFYIFFFNESPLNYVDSSQNEQKAYDAALQVRESVQMVENAMMEKDQVKDDGGLNN